MTVVLVVQLPLHVKLITVGVEVALGVLLFFFKLHGYQKRRLLTFLDPSLSRERVGVWLDERLDDTRLDPTVRARGLAASYRIGPSREVRRDLSQLLDYRDAALRRRELGRTLGLPPIPGSRLDEAARLCWR